MRTTLKTYLAELSRPDMEDAAKLSVRADMEAFLGRHACAILAALESLHANRPLVEAPSLSRILTDAPNVVQLKAEYRALDELHEQVKAWPEGITKATELQNVLTRKAEIAATMLTEVAA